MDYRKEHGIILAQEKEQMIRERTIQEQEFERVKNKILGASPDYLAVVPDDFASWTIKMFIPEWYVDIPDKAKAQQQLDAFNAKLEEVNKAMYEVMLKKKEHSDSVYQGAGNNGS